MLNSAMYDKTLLWIFGQNILSASGFYCRSSVMYQLGKIMPSMPCQKISLSSKELTLQRSMHLNFQRRRLIQLQSWTNWRDM